MRISDWSSDVCSSDLFIGDPLTRQTFERLPRGHHRGVADGVEVAAPEPCREAIEAQDAQMILGDARRGVANERDAPRVEVGQPAEPDRKSTRLNSSH